MTDATHVQTSMFEEGAGRSMYVLGLLEYERPFVGLLDKFLFLRPRGSFRKVRQFVSMILRFFCW